MHSRTAADHLDHLGFRLATLSPKQKRSAILRRTLHLNVATIARLLHEVTKAMVTNGSRFLRHAKSQTHDATCSKANGRVRARSEARSYVQSEKMVEWEHCEKQDIFKLLRWTWFGRGIFWIKRNYHLSVIKNYRNEKGEFNNLCNDLRNHTEKFFNCARKSISTVDYT